MNRDKEWLKQSVRGMCQSRVLQSITINVDVLDNLIKQLDEPEITEEKAWKAISKKYNQDANYWVDVKNFYINSIKQSDLPVIPQFVADHIEVRKKVGKRLNVALSESPESSMSEKMNIAIFEANNIYARAWLDGYTIEKEKLYFVRENNYLLCKYNDEVIDYVEAVEREITDLVNLKLTEKEIKDYDERYLAFAEPVAK